jgi:hypothetical protein
MEIFLRDKDPATLQATIHLFISLNPSWAPNQEILNSWILRFPGW